MSSALSAGNVLALIGVVLVLLGLGAPGGSGIPSDVPHSPLAAFLPPWVATLIGIGGFGIAALGLFLNGLPTSPDDRDWIPDEAEMDEWEGDEER